MIITGNYECTLRLPVCHWSLINTFLTGPPHVYTHTVIANLRLALGSKHILLSSSPWFLCDPMVVQTVALLYKNRFARRGWDTRSEKTGERVRVRTKREKRDRVSKKRTLCIQCNKRRQKTNLSGWARGFCTKHARDAGCTFPQERRKKKYTRIKQNKKEKHGLLNPC